MLLAAAVACLTSTVPGSHLRFGDLPERSRTRAGGIVTRADPQPEPVLILARTLDPAQRLLYDQLPAEDREGYLRELRKRSPIPGGRPTLSGYLPAVGEAPRRLPPEHARFTRLGARRTAPLRPILVSSYGPTLARFDAALEAPHRSRR